MKRTHLRVATSALAVLTIGTLLTACGGTSSGSASSGARADTVIIGTGAIPQTLDPILGSDVQTDFTDGALYDKLVDYDANGNLVPQIATAWDYNADATQVTLTLRDDVTFHNGDKLTSAD